MKTTLACDKERVESLYRTLPQNLVATFAAAAALAYCVYQITDLTASLYWLAAVALVNIARVPLFATERRLRDGKISPYTAAAAFDLGVFFAGISWGCAFLIIPDGLGVATSYVAVSVACVMAVACNAYQASFSAVTLFNIPIIVIFVGKYSLLGDTTVLAWSSVIYLALLLLNGRRTAKRIAQEIMLRHEHDELLTQLASEKRKTEALNEDLELKVAQRTRSLHELNRELQAEVSEKQSAQQELAKINTQFGALYDEHPSILLTLSTAGFLANVNKYGARYLGYPHSALLRMKFSELCTDGDSAAELLKPLTTGQLLETRGRLQLVKSAGEVIAVQATFRRVDANPEESQIIVVCEDVTEIDRLQKQLSYHASRDTLTGLYNRREFEIRINQLFERTKRHLDQHTICVIDLDRFKLINDTSGHQAGDETLKAITSAMTACMRQTDVLARLGGDEFGIIMEKTTLAEAEDIIERLRATIEKIDIVWDGVHHQIGASFGLTRLDANSVSVSDLMRDADAACYLAKESGRNCIRTLDGNTPRGTSEIRKFPSWSSKLRKAVADERLFLALQPVVNQQDQSISQHEALLRIQDEEGNHADAQLFIAAAERLGLITVLDKWMLDNALDLLQNDRRFASDSNIALNLSEDSLADESVCGHIRQALSNDPGIAAKICFEVKETALLHGQQKIIDSLKTFRALGTKLTIDDFGTSLAGLRPLDGLTVDFVKLDPLLIEALEKNLGAKELLEASLSVAEKLGSRAIAKGVSSERQIEALRELGIVDMQGYAIRRPVNVLSESLAALKQSA